MSSTPGLPEQIRDAFFPAVRPAPAEIATCPCGECAGIREFFAAQPQYDVPLHLLSSFRTALGLFSDTAFSYWLPAFMLAELSDERRDSFDIADWIAWRFIPTRHGGERTHLLSRRQADVVALFLDECSRRYPDPEMSADFAAAAARVRGFNADCAT